MNKYRHLATPYLIWMLILTLLPILIMVVLSFLSIKGFDLSTASFSLAAFSKTFNREYFIAFTISLKLAGLATLFCVLLGYPVAYIISNLKIANRFSFLLILILPMFTNLLLRVNTINRLLLPEGFMKMFLELP